MATTTTNYGFDVPTSADLVKNGATQIALLGQDLDTFLFRPFTRNGVINGGMDIWQRGTSFAIPSSTYTYTADRWIGLRFSTGSTVTQQTSGLTGFQYSIRSSRDSGNTGLGLIYLGYNLETADSYRYAGQTTTLSFYAKAGANYSSASSALAVIWASGTGTNQKQMDGFTGASTLVSSSVTLTTSWQRFTFTATVPTNSTQQGFQFNYTPVGTAGAADNFEITGVQLEVGNQVSPFIRAGGNIQGELAACQRYYYRTSQNAAYTNFTGSIAASSSTGAFNLPIWLPVQMRVAPTSIDFSTLRQTDGYAAANTVSAVTIGGNSANIVNVDITSTSMTIGRPVILQSNGTNGYLGFSAEL